MPALPVLIAILLGIAAAVGRSMAPDGEGPSDYGETALIWVLALVLVVASLAMPVLILVTVPLAVAAVFPWATTRLVLAPRGQVGAAWRWTWLATVAWRGDRAGGRLAGAALAHLRSGEERAWLEARLAASVPLGVGSMAAAGLLAAGDGDLRLARALMGTALDVDPQHRPVAGRRLAAHWLTAEAASRGAWSEVEEVAEAHSGPATRFLGLVARRTAPELGDDPSDAELWGAWIAAGHHQAHYELLLRALVAEPRPPEPLDPGEGPPLARAVQALARFDLLLPAGRTLVRAHALGRLWEEALGDPATRAWVEGRAEAVGARPDRVLARLRADVIERLEAVVSAGAEGGEAGAPSALVAEAAAEVLDDLVSAAEDSAEEAGQRLRAGQWLGPVGELRAFAAARAAYDAAVRLGGEPTRALLFAAVHPPLTGMYVKLFNERGERVLANAVNAWLLAEARRAGDAGAAELHEKNLGCL